MNFFFDYIYYRVTKAYLKWDGRVGATAIFGICMIQQLVLMDAFLLIYRLVHGPVKRPSIPGDKFIIIGILVVLFIYNYKKYNKSYNKYRYYWKDESKVKRFYKGILVIMSLILPWVIAFCIALY